jgi:YesN/AraC family two-component response regulator
MTVLIVDDEQHVIDALLLLIPWEEMGVDRTLVAGSVPEAIRLLEEEKPEIAFVDVVIGNMLGTEILNHINSERLRTKAIAISGYDDYEYIRTMFILGGVDYLLKPIEQQVAIQALQKAISKVRQAASGHEEDSGGEMPLDKNSRSHIDARIQHIADYLEQNFNKKIQQQACADFFHLNKDYMCRRFKEIIGIGMVDYLNGIRIRRAKELLVESDLQIQEIADEVGFFDTKYFAKQFRREIGQSPTAYRLNHWSSK